jgi:excisionase family DNA binding protein
MTGLNSLRGQTMAKGKNVLTTGDVARICNVAPRTVSKWFDSGQLKGYRIPGSKDRRIPLDELVRFMKVNNMPIRGLASGKTRVLLVDNDREATHALALGLRKDGDYEVQVVHTTFETGLVAQKFSPHVLVINLIAQGIDAPGICASIRNDPELQTMKILAITGHLGPSECQALLVRGFDDCVEDASDVRGVIKKVEQATAIIY